MTHTPARHSALDCDQALRLARETFDTESAAILGLRQALGLSFLEAVRTMLSVTGRVVVMGMGKSGHIGRKMAATLASTGTPALFVHAGEAIHGDLGMVTADDVVVAISNSGESQELSTILPLLKRLGVRVIAMTGQSGSTLARHADIVLDCSVAKEALVLLDARGFKAEDFARSHPGGALGRKLLTHVQDVMRSGDAVPRIAGHASLTDMMREMSEKGLGAVAIVDADQRVLGIFTDGDLRRLVEKGADLRALTACAVMHRAPRTIARQALAVDAAQLMEQHRITSVLVVDEAGALCGALNSNDLMRAKVI